MNLKDFEREQESYKINAMVDLQITLDAIEHMENQLNNLQ
jgi:hypothetical protein